MNVAVEELGSCRRKLTIEVPGEKVAETYQTVLSEFVRHAQIKGFRPGKAPPKVVAARFKKQIQEELLDQLVPSGYQQALEQEALAPVAVIDIEKNEVAPDQPFTFTVTCDLPPEFDVPTYRGLKLSSDRQAVEEADVDRAIAQVMDRFANYEDADRAIQNEDLVQIDFEGRIGERLVSEFAPGLEAMGKAVDFWMQAGDQAFLPEIGEAVLGAKPGDSLRIDVVFGPDFATEELQGRQAVYEVVVKGVRVKVVPEMTQEHLSQLGMESETQLRERVQADLERQAELAERRQLRDQMVRLLLDATEFELPASVVEDETRTTIYDMVRNISRQGAREEDIRDRRDELFELASRSAEENVKTRFVLAAIAKSEGITVEPSEVEERIRMMALRYQMPVDELRSELKSRNRLVNVHQDVRFEKTMDFLVEHAEITRRM